MSCCGTRQATHGQQGPATQPVASREPKFDEATEHETDPRELERRLDFLAQAGIQPKLQVSAPGDPDEREADAIADLVMAQREPTGEVMQIGPASNPAALDRKCSACEKEDEEEGRVARSAGNSADVAAKAVSNAADAVTQGGMPLPASERQFFEPRFGHDLGGIRIHIGSQAHRAATGINALAYTYRQNIAFANGQYAPGSFAGRKLLAHEIAHSLQQGQAGRSSSSANVNGVQPAVNPKVRPGAENVIFRQCPPPVRTRGAAGGCGVCMGGDSRIIGTRMHLLIQYAFFMEDSSLIPGGGAMEFVVPVVPEGETAPFRPEVDLARITVESGLRKIEIAEIKPFDDAGNQRAIARNKLNDYVRELDLGDQFDEVNLLTMDPPDSFPVVEETKPPGCPMQMMNVCQVEPGIYQYYCEPPWADLVRDPRCNCRRRRRQRDRRRQPQTDQRTDRNTDDNSQPSNEPRNDIRPLPHTPLQETPQENPQQQPETRPGPQEQPQPGDQPDELPQPGRHPEETPDTEEPPVEDAPENPPHHPPIVTEGPRQTQPNEGGGEETEPPDNVIEGPWGGRQPAPETEGEWEGEGLQDAARVGLGVAAAALVLYGAKKLLSAGARRVIAPLEAMALAALVVFYADRAEARVGPGESPLETLFDAMEQDGIPVDDAMRARIEADPALKQALEEAARTGNLTDAQRAISQRTMEIISENPEAFSDEDLRILAEMTQQASGDSPATQPSVETLRRAIEAKRAGRPIGGIIDEAVQQGRSQDAQQPESQPEQTPPDPETPPPQEELDIPDEYRQRLAEFPERERLLRAMAGHGDGPTITAEVLDRFLATVPQDLTAEEAEQLIAELGPVDGQTLDEIFARLERGIERVRSDEQAGDAPAEGTEEVPDAPQETPELAEGDAANVEQVETPPSGTEPPQGDQSQQQPAPPQQGPSTSTTPGQTPGRGRECVLSTSQLTKLREFLNGSPTPKVITLPKASDRVVGHRFTSLVAENDGAGGLVAGFMTMEIREVRSNNLLVRLHPARFFSADCSIIGVFPTVPTDSEVFPLP